MQFFCTPYAFLLHFFCTLLVNGLSLTFGLLQIPVVHEIKQAWYTCEILFKYVINWDTWAEPRFISLCIFLIYLQYDTWEELSLTHMCNDLIVQFPFSKTSWFSKFSDKIWWAIHKITDFYMHFLCISFALLMHFLCTSYALFMQFLEVHKKCIRNACTLNQSACTFFALLKNA